MKAYESKFKQYKCTFIKKGTLIKCGLYTTENAFALKLLLLIGMRDLMIGGMVETQALVQVISQNMTL